MARQVGEEVMLDKGLTEALNYGKCQSAVKEYRNTLLYEYTPVCTHIAYTV